MISMPSLIFSMFGNHVFRPVISLSSLFFLKFRSDYMLLLHPHFPDSCVYYLQTSQRDLESGHENEVAPLEFDMCLYAAKIVNILSV